jgi:3-oxoacyl-[acyl-carrier-protein] synthase-3
MKRSAISSLETYLPERILSNQDLSKFVDTSDDWIVEMTGIRNRHVVSKGEFVHDIAAKAALKSIKTEGISPLEIGAIVVATTTAEKKCPSSAARIQSIIGAHNAFALDIQAACAGFIYALTIADSFVKSGTAKRVLLIGAETLTLFTDWSDRTTCVLLGDGAGACFVKEAHDESSIVATKLFANGDKYNLIMIENSEQNDHRGHMTMQGRPVFKCAIEYMYDAMVKILQENNMTFDDIDWIVPHQANRRILESLGKMKGLPVEKVILTIDEHANTSSASIPLALRVAMQNGTIKKGNTLLFTALGAGLVWGSAIVKL